MDNAIDNWKSLREEYQKLNKKLDENINFLSFLSINENKHTDFLAMLIDYKTHGKHYFLESFLSCVFPNINLKDNFKIFTQNNFIDCLIKGENYAIIIENKICGASDQEKQIYRYVEKLKEEKYANDKIYVIYLTLFGGTPSINSLPETLKISLKEQYAEINYNNDIMPWLENDILPNCPYREQTLICSIRLYIDYLKKLLGINENQQIIAKKLLNILEKQYNLASYIEIKNLLFNKNTIDDLEIQDIFNIVLRYLEKENIYYNDSNVAYQLKWILKNKPTSDYKLTWVKRNYAPFNSISYFSYGGIKHIQLATTIAEKYFRIHMRCDIEGIKRGAYLLANREEDIKQIWDIDSLIKNGFNRNSDRNASFILPFEVFTKEKTLIDISEYLENMIKILNRIQKENK